MMTDPRSELLARLPQRAALSLTPTALPDRTHRPARDAARDARGTGNMLASLEGLDLLGVPLDRRGAWYQYHHLFRELVGSESGQSQPKQAQQLHARAAAWCEANGLLELAIDHAQAAGDADRVARLVESLAFPAYAGGRVATARRWFQWFEDQKLIERYPPVAVLGACLQALVGQPADTERWAAAAELGSAAGTLKRPSTVEGLMALLRALLCRGGVNRMCADAQAAVATLRPGSPWRATALLLEGIAYLLAGEAEWADAVLAHTVEVATHTGALPAVAVALAERSLIAMERHDWMQAETLAERALAIVRAGQLDDYVVRLFIHAVPARVALHQSDVPRAREQLALRSKLDTVRGQSIGASSLTRAELRVLPLLSTHFTFREIGERLYLSHNTVKKHALSVYHKLGVSSRSEAVQRAQQIGLVPFSLMRWPAWLHAADRHHLGRKPRSE